jgi:hypothetical protein
VPVKYVYGVTASSTPVPSHPGIDGRQLQLVESDDVAALVSDAPGEDLELGRQAMTMHARVLEEAHKAGTVLPMRFGMVMADEDEVRQRLLASHREVLAAQLVEFAGKAELRLRATYEEEPLMREIVAGDQDVARLRESLRGLPEDATYYGRIQLGELVSQAVQRKRDADAAWILDQLAPLALALDVSDPPHERIVLSASFLIDEPRMPEFDAAVNRVGEAQAARMRMKYTGPLPPHSFVRLAEVA